MRRVWLVSALLLASCGGGGGGGTPPPPAPPPAPPTQPAATGDLAAFVHNELIPSIRNVSGSGSGADPNDQRNEYILPTTGQLAAWRTVFERIVAGDYAGAHHLAKSISVTYNLVQYTDTVTGRRYQVLMEGVPGAIPAAAAHSTGISITDPNDPTRRGWGTYIFLPSPQRLVSLHAPHPKDDLETGDQAIDIFLDIGAHSLLLAGADRDQNTALAACDQSSRPYLQADVCHNRDTVFQIAFEELYAREPNLYHLQLHGNATCAVDVFLSNGVMNPPAILFALANNIVAASTTAAGGGAVLTADVFDHPNDCTLVGRQNTQMRFAAGIPHADICLTNNDPTQPSRFFHIEQLRAARRTPTDPLATPGRHRMILSAAIRQTFP